MTAFGQGLPEGNFGAPHHDPFGVAYGGPPPAGYPPAAPPPAKPARTGCSALAMILGIIGVALALVPFYTDLPYWIGLIGAASALGGVGAGVVGLRQVASGAGAVSGLVASGVAIVLAVVTVLIQVNHHAEPPAAAPASDRDETKDTATVLRDQLEVSFGTFEFVARDGRVWDARIPVTFHNKMDGTRDFYVVVGGFDGDGTQLAHGVGGGPPMLLLAPGPMEAGATTTVDYLTTVGLQIPPERAEQLRSATFRVIMASSRAV